MPAMPPRSVSVSFSSYAMSALSQQTMTAYLDDVANMTREYFLCIGNHHPLEAMSQGIRHKYALWSLVEKHRSGRHDHRIEDFSEMEFGYRLPG